MTRLLCYSIMTDVGAIKPHAPKEAMEAVLRLARLPRSAARYRQLAEKISLDRCSDETFRKLRTTLQTWFPSNPGPRQFELC